MLDSLMESWVEISLIGSSMKPNFDKPQSNLVRLRHFLFLKINVTGSHHLMGLDPTNGPAMKPVMVKFILQ